MKRLIKYLLLNKIIARLLIKPILKLHSLSYALSGVYAIMLNNGIHPKHRIIKYKEWFLEEIHNDWVVLDVGCNTGMMPEVMSSKAKFVYGIEMNCSMIEIAKSKIDKKNIEFICADATVFNYSDLKPIDCVTLSNVLEHIEHRVEFLKKLVSQIKWKNEKRFLIRVPMIDREWIVLYKQELGLEYRLDRTHFTEYIFKDFEQELSNANMKILNYDIRWGEIYATCIAK